ncbi:unnamed protein product [Linum tenue]|uniref:Uncharacterized protein n=1 Tax=Linum tenue TaxID=586396 RepID=A0AAV0H9X1_9ROSI|nr:unnamed protein product [Linum tenue]
MINNTNLFFPFYYFMNIITLTSANPLLMIHRHPLFLVLVLVVLSSLPLGSPDDLLESLHPDNLCIYKGLGRACEHPFPPTKTMFIPDKDCQKPDLLATSSDFLRVWRISDDRVELKSLLNGNKNSEYCGPLTSFDWNEAEPKRIGTSSIDATCTIWDIERETIDEIGGRVGNLEESRQ